MANVSFRPFLLSDLYAIDVQPRHVNARDLTLNSATALSFMARDSEAFTMISDGKVKACCGWINREIWAFLAADLKKEMLVLTREAKRRMDLIVPCKAWVDDTDENAVRWVKLLGFRPVGRGYWEYA